MPIDRGKSLEGTPITGGMGVFEFLGKGQGIAGIGCQVTSRLLGLAESRGPSQAGAVPEKAIIGQCSTL